MTAGVGELAPPPRPRATGPRTVRAAGADPRRWARRARLALPAVAVFAVARVLDVLVAVMVSREPGTSYHGDVLRALSSWDGRWYGAIVARGYPSVLRVGAHGLPGYSALAFFPAYPGAVAFLREVTGLGFVPAGLAVALLAGAVAAAGIPVLLGPYLGRAAATRAGMVWACSPVSGVLVLTYSDGLFTAEAVVFLILLVRGRYWWLVPLTLLLALTRGVMAPFAVVLAVHLWCRRATLQTTRQRVLAALGVVGTGAASLLWPAIVALRTGRADAYLLIQESWQGHLVPLVSWVTGLEEFGSVRSSVQRDVVVLTAVLCVALALASLRIGLPPELGVAAPAQLAYLVLLLPVTSSFLRFTLPLVTLAAGPAVWLRTRTATTVALAGGLLVQVWWLQSHLPYLPALHVIP